MMMKILGAYGPDNKNLILTRFLLHYLKSAGQKPGFNGYGGLADTAMHGVLLMGRSTFSCRGLFWVLRVVSGFGLSKECRSNLEKLMGLMLDQVTLDDLLVSGHDGGVHDVNLVMRLGRVFVSSEEGGLSLQRMKKVGRLVDKYLGEISPDHSLKVLSLLAWLRACQIQPETALMESTELWTCILRYIPMKTCMHRVPVDASERGSQWPDTWPRRLQVPPYWLNSSQARIYGKSAPDDFTSDYEHWKCIIAKSYLSGLGIDWSRVRNVNGMLQFAKEAAPDKERTYCQ